MRHDLNPIERFFAALPDTVAYVLGYGMLVWMGAMFVWFVVGL